MKRRRSSMLAPASSGNPFVIMRNGSPAACASMVVITIFPSVKGRWFQLKAIIFLLLGRTHVTFYESPYFTTFCRPSGVSFLPLIPAATLCPTAEEADGVYIAHDLIHPSHYSDMPVRMCYPTTQVFVLLTSTHTASFAREMSLTGMESVII